MISRYGSLAGLMISPGIRVSGSVLEPGIGGNLRPHLQNKGPGFRVSQRPGRLKIMCEYGELSDLSIAAQREQCVLELVLGEHM